LIPKVNRPEFRLVVNSTKASENDPGSSQGSGVAYEHLPRGHEKDPKHASTESQKAASDEASPQTREALSAQSISDQMDLDRLVLEFHEEQTSDAARPGLTTRYSREDAGAKGLLLNKKAE